MLPENERIKTKSDLNRALKIEIQNYGADYSLKTRLLSLLGIRESDILIKHIILLRKTEYYLNSHRIIRGSISKIKLRKLQNKYCIHVPLNCCDVGLKIMHIGPILINEKATIGKNCAFHINTAVVAGGDCPKTLESNFHVF